MAYDYEALYATTPDALGEAADWVKTFFDTYEGSPLRVLDIGCGQGRDSLYAVAKGHSVLGIDQAPSGIKALIEGGAGLAGKVRGEVADLRTFRPNEPYDLLLINRTLHMLEKQERENLLRGLMKRLHRPGFILIADEPRNMVGFHRLIEESEPSTCCQAKTRNSLVFSLQAY